VRSGARQRKEENGTVRSVFKSDQSHNKGLREGKAPKRIGRRLAGIHVRKEKD